ncbi:hypothetical protein EHI8A_144450 [Entamoeba histolytica HM-1:IMSS-B]|uniref:Uncharacterized protein n=7 Tax=Entamoeba TaxID=5758 RepID=C4M414_ENTH1|nr:hypothetical protein EHI_195090 [Entamoeba histolytica HM-1:IMSS]EMD46290.1 Hypothetical protein EHI5A_150750 [Entamoeba histolytica KU27]EMH75293.1 hypothetical protein EHI8A_144450 [Entamoeba histolytica HM-1:IMSS-B]EMS12323.1 hypothetical protein KM1_223640 [Entamoeba histolytica HM-3:IMSS]ENY66057.1 hypothetical protein EHI7A_133170 [Entamoeba histolytica HM-1:IMSS-A]GAT96083.1 hypothetical protein CL6EHI_195090 [Entamoeba histolytica]|eukprot:XP_653869.1 hypothetical protein EHI_195090 [Entamoeba histolytica HM-1:IMSS]
MLNYTLTTFSYGLLFIFAYLLLPFLHGHLSTEPIHQILVWYLYDSLKYPLLSLFIAFILAIICIVHGETQWKEVSSGMYQNLSLDYSERFLISIVLLLSSFGLIELCITFPKAIGIIIKTLFGTTPVSVKASEIQDEIRDLNKHQMILIDKQQKGELLREEELNELQSFSNKEMQLQHKFKQVLRTKTRREIFQAIGIFIGFVICVSIIIVGICMAIDGVSLPKRSECGILCGFWVNERGVFDEIISMFGVFAPWVYGISTIILMLIHCLGIFCSKQENGGFKLEFISLRKRDYSKLVEVIGLLLIGFGGVPLLQHIINPNLYLNTQVDIYNIGQLHFPFFGIFLAIIRWVFILNFFISIIYAFVYNKANESSTTMDDLVIPFYLR